MLHTTDCNWINHKGSLRSDCGNRIRPKYFPSSSNLGSINSSLRFPDWCFSLQIYIFNTEKKPQNCISERGLFLFWGLSVLLILNAIGHKIPKRIPHPLKVLEWALPEHIIFPTTSQKQPNQALPVVLIITCQWCTRKRVLLLLRGTAAGHSQQRKTTALSRSEAVRLGRMLQAHFVRARPGTSTSCHAAPQRLCLPKHCCKDAVLQSVSGPKERTVEAEGIEPWLEAYAYILSIQVFTSPSAGSHTV